MKVDAVSALHASDPQGKPQFTNKEKRDELAREINLRKTVYPGLVRARRLTHEQAERQKAIMTSIWEEFRDRVSAETKGEDKQVDLLEESDQPENRETETELATDDQARHSAIDRSEIQRPSFDNDVESAPSNNDGLVTKDD